VALAWLWYVRLARCGTDAGPFVSALARYAARAVRSGWRLAGGEPPNDVLSPRAQRTRGFTVTSLPGFSTLAGTPLEEALHDNTQTPVPEQVSFRCDFPAWLAGRTERDRRLADDLMLGERTRDVSRKYGLSPARVSPLRREFHGDWLRFRGAGAPDDSTPGPG
jgi:hypothetical protein